MLLLLRDYYLEHGSFPTTVLARLKRSMGRGEKELPQILPLRDAKHQDDSSPGNGVGEVCVSG